MNDGKRRAKGGRPCTVNEQTLPLLLEAYSYGMPDREACAYAGVSCAALYRYAERHPDFREQKELIKATPTIKARRNVVDRINNGDVATSQWWLERKARDEFSTRQDVRVTGDGLQGTAEALADRIRDYIEGA